MRRTRLEKAIAVKPQHHKKVRASVWLELSQIDTLKALSAKTKIPQAVIIRRGVDYAIQYFAAAIFAPLKEQKP